MDTTSNSLFSFVLLQVRNKQYSKVAVSLNLLANISLIFSHVSPTEAGKGLVASLNLCMCEQTHGCVYVCIILCECMFVYVCMYV